MHHFIRNIFNYIIISDPINFKLQRPSSTDNTQFFNNIRLRKLWYFSKICNLLQLTNIIMLHFEDLAINLITKLSLFAKHASLVFHGKFTKVPVFLIEIEPRAPDIEPSVAHGEPRELPSRSGEQNLMAIIETDGIVAIIAALSGVHFHPHFALEVSSHAIPTALKQN